MLSILFNTRTPIVMCLVALATPASLAAQARGTGTPPPIEAMHRKVHDLLSPLETPGSPGCAVSVTRNSVPIFAGGYGLADLEQRLHITPQTAFYAASVSKQFTAASIGLLILRGQLTLETPVRELVPEVPDYGTPITVGHLLHHTSGLRDYLTLQGIAGWPEDMLLTERDFLAMVSRQKGLIFSPGTRHLYSNTGYVLLSIIVRKVSGLSLREFAAMELFAPLGMAQTVFRDNHTTPVPRRATAYGPVDGGGFRVRGPGFDVVGDGGLFTTVEDLAKWNPTALDRALHAPGLSALMVERGRLTSGETITYAMGLNVSTYRGLPLVRHGGSYGGYRAEFTVVPAANMTIALLCNVSSAAPFVLSQRIMDVYLSDQLAPAAPMAVPAGTAGSLLSGILREIGDLPGAYFSEELDVRWTIHPGPTHGIALQRRNLPLTELASHDAAKTRFTAVGAPLEVRFERDASGRVTGFIINSGDITGIRFVKLR